MPITLVDFEATSVDNNHVELIWTTASEQDNDFFTIERSNDGVNFETVEIIDGAGTSTMMNTYRTTDRNPMSGVSYYRLKQTDYNGDFTYSNIDVVSFDKSSDQIELHPNPLNGNGQLLFNSVFNAFVTVDVLDVSGRIVLSKSIKADKGDNSVTIDLEMLNEGLYILSLKNGEKVSTLKFIKE
jgi:hypothetical protein